MERGIGRGMGADILVLFCVLLLGDEREGRREREGGVQKVRSNSAAAKGELAEREGKVEEVL